MREMFIGCTLVKAGTKRGQRLIQSAESNLGYKLSDVYSSWSRAKDEAMSSCWWRYHMEGGKNFRIISKCVNFFTVAWEVPEGLRIETAHNSYLVLTEDN